MFDFAKEAGQALRNAICRGNDDVSAQELAETLQAKGVTIEGGRITIQNDTVTINGVADTLAEKEKAILILGNTKGIARVNDQIQVKAGEGVQPTANASRFYQVKSGDTLSKIAKELYGDANAYNQIFEANRPMLKDPDEIYPGQMLRIPQH